LGSVGYLRRCLRYGRFWHLWPCEDSRIRRWRRNIRAERSWNRRYFGSVWARTIRVLRHHVPHFSPRCAASHYFSSAECLSLAREAGRSQSRCLAARGASAVYRGSGDPRSPCRRGFTRGGAIEAACWPRDLQTEALIGPVEVAREVVGCTSSDPGLNPVE